MKKLGALFLMTAMTLFAFIAVAGPAAAHTGSVASSQTCESATVTANLDSNVAATATWTFTSDIPGVTNASGTGPGAAQVVNQTVPDSGTLAGTATLTITFGQETNVYSTMLTPAGDCQTTTTVTTTTVPPCEECTTTTTVPPTTTTVPPTHTVPPTTTTTVPPTTVTHTTHTSVPPTHETKPPKVTKSPPSELAFTGVENIVPIAVGALVLLVAGSAMLWVARRRTDA